jgi:hypothetical protein
VQFARTVLFLRAGRPGRCRDVGVTGRQQRVSEMTDHRKSAGGAGRTSRWVGALLWVLAIVLMMTAAVYQRRTGPTYPLRGTVAIAGVDHSYKFLRSNNSTHDARVEFPRGAGEIGGRLSYKRYPTADTFTEVPMVTEGDQLVGRLPAQPPAGKLEYYVQIDGPGGATRIPEDPAKNVIIRYKGPVPAGVLVPHILFMFFSMLIGMRAALGAIFAPDTMRRYAWISLIGISVGGMVLGPIVQKFAFGAFWTGFPFGYDLTDNKTLIMWVVWVLACLVLGWTPRKDERLGRLAVVLAALVMTVVYLIPHSLRGSELDYDQLDRGASPTEAISTAE